MSLFGAMRTAISGMTAQSNRISSVSDNIANSATMGYKRSSVEFETLLGNTMPMGYASGGVISKFRYGLSEQGSLQNSASITDLAIQGRGFFVVNSPSGTPLLTRAGSFVPDSSGNLVNSAGLSLMGLDLRANPNGALAGLSSLTRVNINQVGLVASATTEASVAANLPSTATSVASGQLPSANSASASFTAKTSMIAYDNLGAPIMLDVYFTKTGANVWEAAVFNHADAASNGGFPYAAAALGVQTLAFNASDGALSAPTNVSLTIPNGNTISLDFANTTQLAANFLVSGQEIDGNAPSQLDHIEIGDDGILAAIYQNGARIDAFRIPLASCASPDRLTLQDGNAFAESLDSGNIVIGDPQSGQFGSVKSGSLESSTVDLADELTNMIEAQRGYTANSKVFQAGSELADVVIGLKR